ncbi:energy transducer TonB [Fodinibius sp. AD559]|uniref:energy transducer TonB n=1 Tax=Fodinibius sp. AD559 TaxID=3424179 RepID=UPI004046C7F8
MSSGLKDPKYDLRNYYKLFLEIGLIVALLIFIVAMKIDFKTEKSEVQLTEEQTVVTMEEVEQTKQEERPPPPPKPQVPVEVPNDEIIEDQTINIDAEIKVDEALEVPDPPQEAEEEDEEEEEDFFVAVEHMPELKGGLAKLQQCVEYPDMARKAGIEGRVVVRFIVNEQGKVEDPEVVRSIGGGADEEALRCVKQAEFEPGRQRGVPVRVQYSLPVVFKLQE